MTMDGAVEIREVAECHARPREVWKLLYDPVRFATWWPGWERVEPASGTAVTHYDSRYPDFAYPATVTQDPAGGRVVISCLLSDIVHTWAIEPHDEGCLVSVLLTIPAAEAARSQEAGITVRRALTALVAHAEEGGSSSADWQ
ncbi:MAG: hypothetical protein NVSMB32_13350 [Actinomycetota bacterium]